MAFFFHYQGAKGDRGMTGDAGEKGEQVKRDFLPNSAFTVIVPS